MVAIIVAFTTIGAILFWSWEGRKSKLFSQTWQTFSSTAKDIAVLETDTNRRFDSRLSIDREIDEDEIAVIPETTSKSKQVSPFNFSKPNVLTGQKQNTTSKDDRRTIIAFPPPTPPIATQPPDTTETPTPPIATETPTPPIATQPPDTTETPTSPKETFSDVPSDYWAYPFIEPLIEKDLIVGISETEFRPNQPITRAQLALEIEKAFQQETSRDLIDFGDVSQESRAANKIDEAVRKGFLKGYPGNVFRPDQQVPRLQVLVALASGLGLKPSKNPDIILRSYQDIDIIPDWAKEKIAASIEAGLVVNRPGFDVARIYPDDSATRAEVVAMIYQGLVKVDRVPKISSPYIVPNR